MACTPMMGINMSHWRDLAGSVFDTEKIPASGSRGMVVTNTPGVLTECTAATPSMQPSRRYSRSRW